jgi:HPt (histidine-containing phosphotransfer) domain-containing protein
LQTLLDDVITLSRHDGEDESSHEDCDPAQAARAVARLLQPRAWEKHLRLNVSAAPQLPRVNCDPRRIRQVLLKLTENALKFTERGGVEIRIESETRDDLPFLRFSVSDTGLGVREEIAAHLFEPFAAGDVSYTRRHQGAGLGLAVAKRIVDSLSGTIGFETQPGEGSTFWFSVPVSRAVSTEREAQSLSTAPPPTERSYLVHVNDPRVRVVLANLLEPFGNKIEQVEDMAETVTRAGSEAFDAIIVAANDADTLAATPGNKTPVVALLFAGERTPIGAAAILRWPAEPADLYGALRSMQPRDREPARPALEPEGPAAIDAPTFAALEKSVGLTTLIEILHSYIETAEELSNNFAAACQAENWDEAARLAQDMAGAAGGLGLAAMTSAARSFAQKTRDGEGHLALRNAAQTIVGEQLRARAALVNLYPDLAA